MPRDRTVVLPLQVLPPIIREYPEIANQFVLRHGYITRLEQRPDVAESWLVLRPLASLQAEYELVFATYPVLLQQLQTADCYLRGLLHRRAMRHR